MRRPFLEEKPEVFIRMFNKTLAAIDKEIQETSVS